MATTRSGTGRVDRPYRALPVSVPTRIALRWHARADRRAGLPLGMAPDSTPVLQSLTARHGEACERERTRFVADVRPIDVRLGRLEAELPSLRAMLDDRSAEVARATVPLTEHQLTRRLAGEQGLPAALVRQRRQTTHDRALEVARAAQLTAQRTVDELLSEQAQLRAGRQNRAEITCSRVLRFGDFTRRQAAIYRRALVRKHPDREALTHEWQTDLAPAPPWATPDALLLSTRDAGVAA
ncbi:MAG: hypothetical protein JWQ26_385 [Modestobacter sp.]|nr:hypothetical protein [Modestobacter sp.]